MSTAKVTVAVNEILSELDDKARSHYNTQFKTKICQLVGQQQFEIVLGLVADNKILNNSDLPDILYECVLCLDQAYSEDRPEFLTELKIVLNFLNQLEIVVDAPNCQKNSIISAFGIAINKASTYATSDIEKLDMLIEFGKYAPDSFRIGEFRNLTSFPIFDTEPQELNTAFDEYLTFLGENNQVAEIRACLSSILRTKTDSEIFKTSAVLLQNPYSAAEMHFGLQSVIESITTTIGLLNTLSESEYTTQAFNQILEKLAGIFEHLSKNPDDRLKIANFLNGTETPELLATNTLCLSIEDIVSLATASVNKTQIHRF